MKKNSILSELTNMANQELKVNLVESRAQHIISSVIYLVEQIDENFSEDDADMLKKKLLNSIRVKDPSKFLKAMQKAKDAKWVQLMK